MKNTLNYIEYGDPNGRGVVYFHGTPGSIEECSVFHDFGLKNNLNILCFDRFSIDLKKRGKVYYEYLASCIDETCNDDSLDVIGFSIGCDVAINVIPYLSARINNVHLISAAAPLNGGDFLDKMAGKMVFTLANKYPFIFTILSYWQSLLAWVYPTTLFSMLFASAVAGDEVLSKDDGFKDYVVLVLKKCFTKNVAGYVRDVKEYIAFSDQNFFSFKADTYIWHGGDDNWSPVGMAHYLSRELPNVVNIEIMDGLSHYSCLYEAVPTVCNQLGRYHEKCDE